MEISSIRGACGVSGWDGESNESVYGQFGVGVTVKGVECGIGDVWCDKKKVCEGRIKGDGVRERPPVKWINRVSEYWSERVGSSRIECAERECQNRERWRHFCCSHPMEGGSCKRAGRRRYR